jgi:hypothetical protein
VGEEGLSKRVAVLQYDFVAVWTAAQQHRITAARNQRLLFFDKS